MTTATTTALYIDDNGRVACDRPRCIGSAARSILDRTPNAALLRTSLGTWERVDADTAAEYGLACETCR